MRLPHLIHEPLFSLKHCPLLLESLLFFLRAESFSLFHCYIKAYAFSILEHVLFIFATNYFVQAIINVLFQFLAETWFFGLFIFGSTISWVDEWVKN